MKLSEIINENLSIGKELVDLVLSLKNEPGKKYLLKGFILYNKEHSNEFPCDEARIQLDIKGKRSCGAFAGHSPSELFQIFEKFIDNPESEYYKSGITGKTKSITPSAGTDTDSGSPTNSSRAIYFIDIKSNIAKSLAEYIKEHKDSLKNKLYLRFNKTQISEVNSTW